MIMDTRVYILYTGGTIGMAPKDPDDPYSPLEPKSLTKLIDYVPGFMASEEPKELTSDSSQERAYVTLELDSGNKIKITGDSLLKPVDSSDISPVQWREIAAKIREVYDDYDGFVILHGTDTMAFTSSALSFMFENLGKPVVITGSQLPISGKRTDAVLNLINALYIAGYKVTDLPLIPEVVIVFADKVIRGCRASKVSTSDWAGFDSPNFPLLGTIGEHIVIKSGYLLPPPTGNKTFFVNSDLDPHIFSVNIFPGFTNEQMEKLFLDSKIKGILMRSYGTGNVPGDKPFLSTVSRSIAGESVGGDKIDDGRLVVNLSQCNIGTVEMGLYEASSGLLENGVLSGLDMTPEAALTKLMWTLGTQVDTGRISQMQISQRGEQTENLFDLRFGSISQDQAKDKFTAAVTPDGRLDRNRISRAMLRISKLGVIGAKHGEKVHVRAFMNMQSATLSTPANEARCIAEIDFTNDGKAETRMKNITHKTQNVIGNGEVILTLVAEKETGNIREKVSIYFEGLYIAVYAKA